MHDVVVDDDDGDTNDNDRCRVGTCSIKKSTPRNDIMVKHLLGRFLGRFVRSKSDQVQRQGPTSLSAYRHIHALSGGIQENHAISMITAPKSQSNAGLKFKVIMAPP